MSRKRKHDEKRAARFAERGIDVADLAFSETDYAGVGASNCCLCDTPIKHLFTLTFANRPGRPDVTFAPVGSQCITDWMRALPECPERDAALANVKAAERKRDELMRAKKEAERQAKAREGCIEDMRRNDDEDGAELIRRFFAIEDKDTAKDYDRWSTLADIGRRAVRFRGFSSPKQRRYFAVLVSEAEAHVLAELGDEEKAEAIVARMNGDQGKLMARYYRLPENLRCETLLDMAAGVEKWGRFRSDKAARYFAVKLREAEAKRPAEAQEETEEEPINPVNGILNGNGDDVLAVGNPENMEDFPF